MIFTWTLSLLGLIFPAPHEVDLGKFGIVIRFGKKTVEAVVVLTLNPEDGEETMVCDLFVCSKRRHLEGGVVLDNLCREVIGIMEVPISRLKRAGGGSSIRRSSTFLLLQQIPLASIGHFRALQ